MRSVSIATIQTRARDTADMKGTNFVTDQELIRQISTEYCGLYDRLTTAFEHYNTNPVPFEIDIVAGTTLYDLPDDFFKLDGVDKDMGGGRYTSAKSFEFGERNISNHTDLRYCLVQNKLMIQGNSNSSTQTLRVWYTPTPKEFFGVLSNMTFDADTDTITSAAHGLVDDDFILFTGLDLPTGITIGDDNGLNNRGKYYIVNATTDTFQIATTIGGSALDFTSTGSGSIRGKWYGSGQTVDGVSGWEELIVLNAAIYMVNKENMDASALNRKVKALEKRIDVASQNRDVGSPGKVQDTRGIEIDETFTWIF